MGDKLEDAPVDKESDDSGSEDSGPFKKKFYTMTAKTEAMSKADTKEYQAKNNITMFGKGRKKFKPLQTFAELGFPDTIMKICSGFSNPTPIQAQCWPVLASGRDIIGIAETGSGKTLAFSIPALAHLKHRVETEGRSKAGFPKMLIVSPTRELAMQSQEVLEAAGSSCGVRSVCVYGGVPKWTQKEALKKGVDYVINYSFPLTIEDYVHRIGRTGRAGRDGTAHTFFQLCDKLRAGELVKVLKDANQEVPAAMNDFDLNIKKKEHKLYGAFGPKDYGVPMKKATKITFD